MNGPSISFNEPSRIGGSLTDTIQAAW